MNQLLGRFYYAVFLLQSLVMTTTTVLSSNATTTTITATTDEEFCIYGFVMDKFCIKRGTLLDISSVKTLEGPDRHSVHCLVDVRPCIDSGYEILGEPPSNSSDGLYTREVELDSVGNSMVLTEARRVGSCSTCYGSGDQKDGFAATVIGTLDTTSTSIDGVPRLLVRNLVAGQVDCDELRNSTMVITPTSDANGMMKSKASLFAWTTTTAVLMVSIIMMT